MAKKYLDYDGVLYFWQKIKAAFALKTEVPAKSSTTPKANGTAATGSETAYAAGDHVHPTDTTRAPLASPAFTGTPTAPTAATGTANTQIATTEFVSNTVGAMTSGVADVQIDNTSIVESGIAKIPSLVAGTNVTLTPDASAKTITIAATDTTYTPGKLGFAYAESTTAAATTTKTATVSSGAYTLVSGGIVAVRFRNGIGKIGTLNVSSKGAKQVSYNGTSSNLDFSTLGAGVAYFMYDGTTYNLIGFDYNAASSTTSGYMSAEQATKIDSLTVTNGVIDASNLPSYVDDVIEAYARSGQTALSSTWLATGSASGTVITPETGKIYVLMADSGDYSANTQFRWGGTAYVKMADGGVSSITNAEIDTIVAS